MTVDPTTVLVLLLALLVGAAIGAGLAHARSGVRSARITAERDLLAERLDRRESDEDDDEALTAALAPVTSSMARLERHVGVLERERVEQYGRLGEQLVTDLWLIYRRLKIRHSSIVTLR